MNTTLVFIAVLVHDEDPDRDYAIEPRRWAHVA